MTSSSAPHAHGNRGIRSRFTALLAGLTAAAISILGTSLPAQAASGDPVSYTAPSGAAVTLDHGTYAAGDTITITGSGFIGTNRNYA